MSNVNYRKIIYIYDFYACYVCEFMPKVGLVISTLLLSHCPWQAQWVLEMRQFATLKVGHLNGEQ